MSICLRNIRYVSKEQNLVISFVGDLLEMVFKIKNLVFVRHVLKIVCAIFRANRTKFVGGIRGDMVIFVKLATLTKQKWHHTLKPRQSEVQSILVFSATKNGNLMTI